MYISFTTNQNYNNYTRFSNFTVLAYVDKKTYMHKLITLYISFLYICKSKIYKVILLFVACNNYYIYKFRVEEGWKM